MKYLKQYFDEENLRRTSIENRIIGLKYLQDSSTIEKLHEVVNEKLLSLAPEIPNNFHGIVHDLGTNLSGVHNGLAALLQRQLPNYLMNLEDIVLTLFCINLWILDRQENSLWKRNDYVFF